MDEEPMTELIKTPISLTMAEPLFTRLHRHLFPGDGEEHGAVIAAGMAETPHGTRLLAREVFLAEEGVDYVPGNHGHRMLTGEFVARTSDYCATERLCYLAVHCHGGRDRVAFSKVDLASHARGYPALLDITDGIPVGALVFAENAVAGSLWTREGCFELDHLTLLGPRIRRLYPAPPERRQADDPMYNRHARLFGDVGQARLAELKVGIIGLGGGGSLLNEWLARLGVGHLVAVDFDRMELSNLPRVVGATRKDVEEGQYKVEVAERVARQANPEINYDAVVGSVVDEPVARRLTDADFLFLAGDTMQSRLLFNCLVHQYLIPGFQIGAKVTVDRKSGGIGDVFTVTRPVLPHSGGGCLWCHELISPAGLQEEALSEGERRAQRYVDHAEVAEPSVITLNALSAAPAVNEMLLMLLGLYEEDVQLLHQTNFVRERQLAVSEPRYNPSCPDCGEGPKSRRAHGDGRRLPCRMPPR